jgi:hypothetical protein
MNDRQRAAERRRLELAARIDVQRFRLRLQIRVLALRRPWLGLGPSQAWRRNVLIVGLVLACGAAVFVRARAAATTDPIWRLARLGARSWVVGKLGWQLVHRWRPAHASSASIERTPS